ncbi:MAG: response regulator, partial [Rickettsiaceae bacterium]|nr:response regulator [Rickettsiaceae bacterium]
MKKRNIILFIDDEKVCHTLAELIIPNFTDYKLVGAFCGNEAIELAKRYASDIALVLSDIMLPGINGYQVYSKLKEDKRLFGARIKICEENNEVKEFFKRRMIKSDFKFNPRFDVAKKRIKKQTQK